MAYVPLNRFYHVLLVAVSFFIFPLSFALLSFNYAAAILTPQNGLRRRLRRTPRFKPKKILVTGISSAEGLRVARALWQTGHDVVGADVLKLGLLSPARMSRAVKRLYKLHTRNSNHGPVEYVQELLQLVQKEHVDIWIDCTDSLELYPRAQAAQTIRYKTGCHCISPEIESMAHLQSPTAFLNFAKSRGLPTPESHVVRSRSEVHNVLNQTHGKKRYLLQEPNGRRDVGPEKILPRRSLSQTYQDLSKMQITSTSPWVLEEYVDDRQTLEAFAIVNRGSITAFAASNRSEISHQILPSESGLSQAMLKFMKALVRELEPGLSSHLSITFCLDEKVTQSGVIQQLLPLAAEARVSRNLLHFVGKESAVKLTHAYLQPNAGKSNGESLDRAKDVVIETPQREGVVIYELGRDIQNLLLMPFFSILLLQTSVKRAVQSIALLVGHLIFGHEALYEFWDPVPLFWHYYVTLPTQLLSRYRS